MAHAIGSAVISFGLVSIPCRLYSSHEDQSVHGHMVHAKCGSRLRQQMVCPTDNNEVVERGDLLRGCEVLKGSGQYVTFSNDELRSLEGPRSNVVDLVEFVPASSIDWVQMASTYYLGPDQGAEKAYRLLSEALRRSKRVAIGQYLARGKDHIGMIRPYGKGLALHELYLADEVREFDVAVSNETSHDAEMASAVTLIESMSTERFAPDRFRNEYDVRLRAAIDAKKAGLTVKAATEAKPAKQMADLLTILQKSVAELKAVPKPGPKKASPTPAEEAPKKRKAKR